MRQPGFPDDREWPSLRQRLGPEDRKRIKRLVRQRWAAQREDDAYLAVAYARYTLRWMAFVPAWYIPLLLAFRFVLGLIFYGDPGRALDQMLDSSLIGPVMLGVLLPFIQIVKLQRAEQENVDALWRMSSQQGQEGADSPQGGAPPSTTGGRRGGRR